MSKPSAVEQLDRRIAAIAGALEERRYELAALAVELRDEKVGGWAEKIARHELVRRAPRTVRGWARAWDAAMANIRRRDALTFSGWELVARYRGRVDDDALGEAIDAADGMTVEEMRGAFAGLFGNQTPFDFAEWCRRGVADIHSQIDAAPAPAKPHLEVAAASWQAAGQAR